MLMPLAANVVAQGTVVDSGLKSKVEGQIMGAMELCPTVHCVDKISLERALSYFYSLQLINMHKQKTSEKSCSCHLHSMLSDRA